jgi:hypothetical protein
MYRNLHYLGVSPWDVAPPYHLSSKLAESWPVEGLRLLFFASRMQRAYALSYWLNYSARHPLEWVTPSEDAWAIDLTQLQTAFNSVKRTPPGSPPATWPKWFAGPIVLVPEWENVEKGQGHNRFNFMLTEWQVTKSKLPPIPGSGTTIIHGDQIHMSDIHGNIGHVGSHSSSTVSITEHNSGPRPKDLSGLAEELAQLRLELRRRAETVEHDRAIVAVGEAEDAARKGDGGKVLGLLKKTGTWALKSATEIGTTIAAKAIEAAIGV